MSQWDKTKLYQRKNRCRWKINIWYVTQNYQSLEESKIKSQHTTAHLLESPSQVFVQEKWYIHPQKLKILTTPNANKDAEQLELCIASGGKTKWYSHIGKWFGGLFFKVQHAHKTQPFPPKYLCKRNEDTYIHKNWYTNVNTSSIHNWLKLETIQMPQLVRVWWNRGIFIWWYTTQHMLIYAATQINLKSIMLEERSQTQKATYCMIPFTWPF